jgi:hypothetical protein
MALRSLFAVLALAMLFTPGCHHTTPTRSASCPTPVAAPAPCPCPGGGLPPVGAPVAAPIAVVPPPPIR